MDKLKKLQEAVAELADLADEYTYILRSIDNLSEALAKAADQAGEDNPDLDKALMQGVDLVKKMNSKGQFFLIS